MNKKIKKTKERLIKIYEDGEQYELKLLKELENELRQEKNTLTSEQQKEAMQMGYKLADKMELDMLKLKYKKGLKDNGGIKNKKIEKLIEDLEKKILIN
jgi:polyribonucleotide nucleotidyltransferase